MSSNPIFAWLTKAKLISGGETQEEITSTDCPGDKRALDTKVLNTTSDPIPISGTVSQSDLITGGRVSIIALSSASWTLLPAAALSGRRQLVIINDSGIDVKLNYDTTASLPAGFVGVTLPDGYERHYQAQDTFTVYAKASSGTPSITIEELL